MSTWQNSAESPSQIGVHFVIIFSSADDKIYRTFVKHVYLHIQFVKRNFLDHTVKKPSLPLLNFKTGHFELRREENIVEFLEGRFRNQQL